MIARGPQTNFHAQADALSATGVARGPARGNDGRDHGARHPNPVADVYGPTGLPGRHALDRTLAGLLSAPAASRQCALLVIELGNTHMMRVAFGDSLCDRIIRIAGARLRIGTGHAYSLFALDDGEFALIMPKYSGHEACLGAARAMLASVTEPVRIKGMEYFSPASVGIALADVESETPAGLLHRAQAALRETKRECAGGVKFADSESARRISDELAMANAAQRACERGEFSLHYQPILDMRSREIRGLEALLRWDSPQFGPVSPEHFVPLLEQSGRIREVGEWVLREACRQARNWNRRATKPIRVAVNVSPMQLEHADFETRFLAILAETDCHPEWIELEITESTAIRIHGHVQARLFSLAQHGVTLAIDDFGAGHSSFGRLASLPVHHLKLDRALLLNLPHDRKGIAIVRALQTLSASLGLTLTAEGIERQEQRLFCEQAGLEQGQGFLLNVPATATRIAALLGLRGRSSALAA